VEPSDQDILDRVDSSCEQLGLDLHVSMNVSRRVPSEAPPQPSYVFRGHGAQVHSVLFLRQNLRLLTGDAEGWVVLWSTTTRRAVAVWRPHASAILGLDAWGDDKIITYVLHVNVSDVVKTS